MLKLRAALDNHDEASNEAGLNCSVDLYTGEVIGSRTKQSFRDECDINVIVGRFQIGGQLPQGLKAPAYGDYDTVNDFQTALNVVRDAQETFMEMPANVRARFHNNPQEFLEFVANKDNMAEAEKLGLVFKTEAAAPPPVAGVSAPAPAGASAPQAAPVAPAPSS